MVQFFSVVADVFLQTVSVLRAPAWPVVRVTAGSADCSTGQAQVSTSAHVTPLVPCCPTPLSSPLLMSGSRVTRLRHQSIMASSQLMSVTDPGQLSQCHPGAQGQLMAKSQDNT